MLPGPTASFAGRAVGGLAGKLIADTQPARPAREPEPELGPAESDTSLIAGEDGEPQPAAEDERDSEPGVVLVRGGDEPLGRSTQQTADIQGDEVERAGAERAGVERAGVERAAGERVAGERDMRRTEGARAKTAAPIPSPKSRRRPPAAGTARN
jgi:hypothetical protein